MSLLVFLEKPLKWLPVKQNHGQFTTTLTQLVCFSLNCRFSCMHVPLIDVFNPQARYYKGMLRENPRDWDKNSTCANAKGSKLGREKFLFSSVACFSCSVTSLGHKLNRKEKGVGFFFAPLSERRGKTIPAAGSLSEQVNKMRGSVERVSLDCI